MSILRLKMTPSNAEKECATTVAKSKKQRSIMRGLRQTALNGGYVPIVDHRTGKRGVANVRDLPSVLQLPDDKCREYAAARVGINLRETGHPFHHKTADGTIVTPDPTLEYLVGRLSAEQRQQFNEVYAPTPEQEANAPEAVPVDREYYGRDMYKGLIKHDE